MKTDFQKLSADSRVWIYQNTGPMEKKILPDLQSKLDSFIDSWEAHGHPLQASGQILHDRFIVLIVDEKKNGVSGCSIDSSIAFIKVIEEEFGLQLFDRFAFSYLDGQDVETVSKDQFIKRFQEGIINDETLVFDNLVSTKKDFTETWLKPLKESWHRRFIQRLRDVEKS